MPTRNTITEAKSVNTGDRPSALTRLFYARETLPRHGSIKIRFIDVTGAAVEPINYKR